MSKKTHDKELARARARRQAQRAAARRRRNLIVGAVVFVLLVGGGLAVATFLGDDGDASVAVDDPDAGASADASPSDEASEPVAAAPCPDPSGAPEPDTEMSFDAPPPADEVSGTYRATVETTCGTIVAELDADAAPQTVASFAHLAESGFYRGVPFHRIQEDFVIQGGDPTGTGTGGPGYTFEDELALAEQVVENNDDMYPRGTLAMANSGPDTNGSQFFIVQADPGYPFPPDYAVFGEVVEGMDVVDDIAAGPVTGPRNDQAVDPARILSVTVEPVDGS